MAEIADADLDALGLPDWELERILQDGGSSAESAMRQLSAELARSSCVAAPQVAVASSTGSTSQDALKVTRILITIPPSENATAETVAQFLEGLSETLSAFPGSKTETF